MKGDEASLTGCFKMTVNAEPKLVDLIRRYTWALQYVIDKVFDNIDEFGEWKYYKRTGKVKWQPIISRFHGAFYETLRKYFNLPSAIAQCCIREAMSITKSWMNKEDDDVHSLPKLKSYRMRVNNQNWHFLTEKGKVVELFIGGYGYIKVLDFPRELVKRWKDNGEYREIILKYKDGKVICFVSVMKKIKKVNPSPNAVALDLNFSEIVLGNYEFEYRIKTRMNRIMNIKKNYIEKTQKRYSKSWRFIPGVRRAISRWWNRVHNLNDDFVKRISLYIVKTVKDLGYDTIVLEDLNKLRDKQAKLTKPWRERFTFFSYRKLQRWIEWQGLKHGVAVVYVDPRNTSKVCPYCSSKLKEVEYRKLRCDKCNTEFDRDTAAIINLLNRYLNKFRKRMRGVEVLPDRGGWRCSPKNR